MIYSIDGSLLNININGKIHRFPNNDTGYVEMARAWIEWRKIS